VSEPSETFLERIVASTRAELAERKARVPLDEMRARAAEAPAPRDFAGALRARPGGPARLIAEVKRASPSKGLLAEQFDPVAQAMAYAAGGAAAISVLTEPRYFLGALEHLSAVRAAVGVPVLRKDFLLDPYQVYEARAAGADAALLILAMLADALAADLLALIRSLGMEALVEAHDASEVERAVRLGATVIGVNARDLRTFHVDTAMVRRLRALVPADRIFIAESGVTDWRGAAQARAWGADAALVGEALMRAADPIAKARELSTAPGGMTAKFFANASQPFVKICGLAEPEQAHAAARFGADAFGLVFAPMAPAHRHVTEEQAARIVAGVSTAGATGMPAPVGVFVNPPVDEVAGIAKRVGLGAVQLSGDETPERVERIVSATGLPVIKAVRLRGEADLASLDDYIRAGATLLVDTPARGLYGGAGETGDWTLARRVAEQWPIILAGGLNPANVAEAVAAVAPRGVDVSSGVETERVKDIEKIQMFIEQARSGQPNQPSRFQMEPG
jgi:indole-3-glycerol phosphate synthase/phosphoribosylanthranilate isomerase/anthranilate synthase/indole-3-glycerol phosphate synthase/phosphoribosylanthranilate isomerase